MIGREACFKHQIRDLHEWYLVPILHQGVEEYVQNVA